MKLLTLNTRGLGSHTKPTEVQNLLCSESIDLCFLQETKMEGLVRSVCRRIWYSDDFDAAYKGSNGKLGVYYVSGIQLVFQRVQFKKGKVFCLSRAYLGEIKFLASW